MRALPLLVLLAACGGSTPPPQLRNGTPVAGEGNLCPTGSTASCAATQACQSYSGYQSSTGVCRTICDAGCSAGEHCGSDQTCQCTAGPADGGDSCVASDLACHPEFLVCLPQLPAGTVCPTGERYAATLELCIPQ